MSGGTGHLSKEFFELVKSIGESRSKQEEDSIIFKEVAILKQAMSSREVSNKKMKEYLIRMIYVEMLGQDASFGHIQAVKLVSSRDLLEKRIGYLATTIVLHNDHEFMLLMVNSIQTDLQSDNFLETAMALTVITKLLSKDLVPVLKPLIIRRLEHDRATIRKKAIAACHTLFRLDPTSLHGEMDKVRKTLCDRDPSVMGASLHLFHDLAVMDPASLKDLVPSFVSILKQVTEHRLAREYDYHRMPAPWIQIFILKVLAVLGDSDKRASEGMYQILHEVMKRADIGTNVGYAIVYECVRTVTTIYPDNELIEEAARCISRFISSDNHNLKYLGINALASVVQIDAKYAMEHQMIVIDCLEDPDETLKHKTLELLISMTNPENVTVIVEKLVSYLRSATDVYLRRELVSRITELAEKHAPDTEWYINTMNEVFELGGDLVRAEFAHNLMRLIAESGEQADPEDDMRVFAVDIYLELISKPKLPDVIMQVIAWTLGEFGYLATEKSTEDVLVTLCDAMERQFDSYETRSWFLSAIMKLSAHVGTPPPAVQVLVRKYQRSVHTDLQQRSHEFLELLKEKSTMQAVFPQNSFMEDIDVDETLAFLNGYVQQALDNNARPYSPPDDEAPTEHKKHVSSIKHQAYDTPDPYGMHSGPDPMAEIESEVNTVDADNEGGPLKIRSRGVNPGRRKWGKKAAYEEVGTQEETVSYDSTPNEQPIMDEPAPEPKRNERAAEPAAPVNEERDSFARGLFAGIGGSSKKTARAKRGGSRAAGRRGAPAGRQAAAKPAPQQPEPKQEVDLLGTDFLSGIDMSDQVDPISTNTAPAPSGDVDFLSLGDPTPAAAPAPVQPTAHDDLDLLGFDSPAPQQPQQPQPLQPQNQGPHVDLFFGSATPLNAPAISQPPPAPPVQPFQIKTKEYGGLWKQFRSEVKLQVSPTSCVNPQDYMARMRDSVNIHPVQTIGQEMICAGTVSATNNPVLVHGKLRPGRIELIVRSKDNPSAQTVVPLLRRALL